MSQKGSMYEYIPKLPWIHSVSLGNYRPRVPVCIYTNDRAEVRIRASVHKLDLESVMAHLLSFGKDHQIWVCKNIITMVQYRLGRV